MVSLAFNTYSLYAYHWFQINEVEKLNCISTLGLQKPFQVGTNANFHGSGIHQIWDLPVLEHS